jgi:hypothetical protein
MTNKWTKIFLCRYTNQGWVQNQCFRDLLSATINVNLGNNHKLLTHTDIYIYIHTYTHTHECACAHTFTHVCTSVIQCNASSYLCVGLMEGESNCRALIIPSELALCCLTCRHCALTILQDTKILDKAQDSVEQAFKVTIHIWLPSNNRLQTRPIMESNWTCTVHNGNKQKVRLP